MLLPKPAGRGPSRRERALKPPAEAPRATTSKSPPGYCRNSVIFAAVISDAERIESPAPSASFRIPETGQNSGMYWLEGKVRRRFSLLWRSIFFHFAPTAYGVGDILAPLRG